MDTIASYTKATYLVDEAIVLHLMRYNDTHHIAEVYTRHYGRVSLLVKATRSKRATLHSTLFRPLTQLRLTWPARGKGLVRPKAAELLMAYTDLTFDAKKMAIALFLSEHLLHVLRREQPNTPLFDFVCHAFAWLDAAHKGIANFHLVFLIRLTRFLGFLPYTDDYQQGACFDLLAGHFTTHSPAHGQFITAAEAYYMPLLMRMSFTNMAHFRFNRQQREQCLSYLLRYYQLHIPTLPQTKSLDVLCELW